MTKTISITMIAMTVYAMALTVFTACVKSNNSESQMTAVALQLHQCPECGEDTNCLYEQINENVEGEGTDGEILASIYKVCAANHITDSTTINTLKCEYYVAD